MENNAIQARNWQSRLRKLLPWLWLAAAYLAAVVFSAVYSRGYVDSDMASEMVLADLLNQEGGLLSTNFYYSTELQVLSPPLFFRLGLMLFPQDWSAARAFGQAIMLALIAVSCLYFSYGAGAKRSAPWVAGTILLPFGFWQMHMVTFGGFYPCYIILELLIAGLALRLARDEAAPLWHVVLRVILLGGACFAISLNGPRMLMNLNLPLAAAAAVMLMVRIHMEPQALTQLRRPEWKLTLAAVAATVASMAGYLVNSRFLAASHNFVSFSDRYWSDLKLSSLMETLSYFLAMFGYQGEEWRGSRPGLFTLGGILCLCGLALAAAVMVSAILLLFRWKRLTFGQQAITALFWGVLVVDSLIFSFTAGSTGSSSINYWVPAVPFAFAVVEAAWATTDFHLPLGRWGAAALACLCLLGASTATVQQYLDDPLRAQPAMQNVSQWLTDNGYTEGYASFWNSNVLTELSSGQIECWTVTDVRTMNFYGWLQKTSHETQPPQGKTFVLIGPMDGIADITTLPYLAADESNIVYRDDAGFIILSFESAEEIYAARDAAWAAAEAQAGA